MSLPQDPRGTAKRTVEQTQPLKKPAGSERGTSRGTSGGVDLLQRDENTSDYASLSASLHGTWGNTLIQAALAGRESGPAEIIHGAMTLGTTGMAVPETSGTLFNNSFVNEWMGEHGNAAQADVAVESAPVMRRARSESFEDDAGVKLERASARAGKAMPDAVRREMEAAFGGVDFSGVRIHSDATAREAARVIRAEAYTVGQDIYFDEDFDVRTTQGQHLLAHELTHVVQHQQGRLRAIGDGLKVSSPTDVVEQEAERMAHQVTAELDLVGEIAVESPSAESAPAPESAAAGPDGDGIFRRRRPGGRGRPQDRRALKMKADVKARDQRRKARSPGPKRGGGRKLTPQKHERFNNAFEAFLTQRGPELLAAFGWGVPQEADAKKAKPPQGQAGPEGDTAKGYANWKKQYKEDSRPELEQHQDAGEDLVEFLKDVIGAYNALSHELLGQIAHEDAWKHFTESIEDKDQEGANEGAGEQDGDNQENEAHDGLQGHFDGNHHKAKRHGDGKNANSANAGSFDSGDDSASGQDDVLHGEEKLADGGAKDAASPKVIDVRRSVDCLVDEANRFAQEFLSEVDGTDITEGTGQGGELAGLQANVAAGGGVQDESGDKPGTDDGRQMQVSQSGTVLYSKPGAANPGNVSGRLPPGTAMQASSDNTRPGWTFVTVTDGPLSGQRGWVSSGAARDEDEAPQHGAPDTTDIIATIDALLGQGQTGMRQAEEMIRDPRQSLLKLAGGAMPAAVKETLGETFGWLDKGVDAGLDVLGGLQKHGQVQDLDLQRARRTQGLVRQIAGALGIAPNAVQVDASNEGAKRTRRAGTRGIQEAGKVFLDPAKYDPTTSDGRELLAHEMVHMAQRVLPADGTPKAARFVEAEAEHWAARFARGGGKLPKLKFGVPNGHRAREGDAGGADLKGMLDAYGASCEANGKSVPKVPAAPPRQRQGRIVEDREQKVDLYGDGVDGIADEIKGTSAFDALYDAICDEESTRGPLARVRRTNDYRQLCRMWQGAKEGGPDRGRMMRIFNSEFDGRGFWAETEQAFDMIEACAKRDAKPEPQAGAAQTASEAGVAGGEGDTEQLMEEGGEVVAEGQGQGGAALDQQGMEIDAGMQALMGQSVPEQSPAIASFETMKGVGDGQLDACLGELTHRHNLAGGSYDVGDGRGMQVLEAFGENFLGSAFSGFVDQGLDGMIWDNVGFVADQGLKLLSKGGLKTPFVGPLIGMIANPPWTAQAWGVDQFKGVGENWSRMGDSWEAVSNAQGTDKVGAMLALMADFFGGLRDLTGGLQTVASTLSAICLVGGGILILFGLALIWFFGVGLPLVSFGTWACRIGQILGKVATVLAGITLMLTFLTSMFRAMAALMVPADMYAQQLELVGSDATQFGQRAGAKAADKTADAINSGWRGNMSRRVDDKLAGTPPSSGGDGASQAERLRQANDADLVKLEDEVAQRQKKVEDGEARRADQEADAEKRQQDAEGETKAPKRPGRLARIALAMPILGATIKEAKSAWADVADLANRKGTAANETLSSGVWELAADGLKRNQAKINGKVADVEAAIAQERRSTSPDTQKIRQLQSDLNGLVKDLQGLQKNLDRANDGLDASRAREERMAEKRRRIRNEEEDTPEKKRTVKERIDELLGKKRQLESDRDDKKKALAQAEVGDVEAKRAYDEADAALRNYVEGDEYKAKERVHREKEAASKQSALNDVERFLGEAQQLETQARNAKEARPKRARAAEVAAEGQSARDSADGAMASLKQHEGERLKATSDTGGADGVIDRKLISIGPDGAVISNGRNKTENIALGDIKYPKALRETAQRYLERDRVATARQDEAQKLNSAADALAPKDGAAPELLLSQAEGKRSEASRRRMDWESMGPTRRKDDRRTELIEARRGASYVEEERESYRIRRALEHIHLEHKKVTDDLGDEKALLGHLEQEEHLEGIQGGLMEENQTTSSGNAMGGVGSSYKDLAQGILNGGVFVRGLIGRLSKSTQNCEYVVKSNENKGSSQSLGFVAEVAMYDLIGMKREVGGELKTIGEQQAARENLRAATLSRVLALEPPVSDIQTIVDKRSAAVSAYDKYILAHTEAYAAYQAEMGVGALSAETKKLEGSAEPVKKASAGMATPLAGDRQKESSRQSTLAGGQANAEKPEGGMSGIVASVITKFAGHSDRFKSAPQFGDNAGESLDAGSRMASEDAPQKKQQGADASGQQRAFLDAAISERQRQEQSLTGAQEQVRTKYQEEQAILQGIQLAKGQALQRRETAKAEVESNASAFNQGYTSLEAWRAEYVAARGTLESIE